jgi:hypothetical protein
MVQNGQLKDWMQSWICDTIWEARPDVQSDDGLKSRDALWDIQGSIGTTCRILRT